MNRRALEKAFNEFEQGVDRLDGKPSTDPILIELAKPATHTSGLSPVERPMAKPERSVPGQVRTATTPKPSRPPRKPFFKSAAGLSVAILALLTISLVLFNQMGGE